VKKIFWFPSIFVAFLCWCFEYHNGLPSKNNPAQILIAKLFKMHTNALARNAKIMCCIIKMLDILTHPLVEPYAQTSTLVNLINKNNYTFITHHINGIEPNPTDLFLLLFQKWEKGSLAVLETVLKLLLTIKDSLSNDNEEEKSQKPLCFPF
jgi:hypothetical protein